MAAAPYLLDMTDRHSIRFAAALAALLALPVVPARADVTPRQAMQAMTKAGYWGIGGVTHDDPYYYAAAVGPGRKRVRITVDARSGKIVNVMALPRGAGAVTPMPGRTALPAVPEVEVRTNPIPPRDYYHAPNTTPAIGTVPAPGTAAWVKAPPRCRVLPGC
jgi:hypothetical protein